MTTSIESMRLFYALWPDPNTRTELMALQTTLRGRATRYENLHITLAFLGQQPATLVPTLKEILARIPRVTLPLTLDRVGYFSRNRIAWVGMHDVPDALITLQRDLTQALIEHDASFDNRSSFKPHVTLARDASPPTDIVFTPIDWQANQVALVQSATAGDGVSYRVLATRALEEDVWTPNELGSDTLDQGL